MQAYLHIPSEVPGKVLLAMRHCVASFCGPFRCASHQARMATSYGLCAIKLHACLSTLSALHPNPCVLVSTPLCRAVLQAEQVPSKARTIAESATTSILFQQTLALQEELMAKDKTIEDLKAGLMITCGALKQTNYMEPEVWACRTAGLLMNNTG